MNTRFGTPFVRARRPEHKQQRREAILEAARDLAVSRGVRAVTLVEHELFCELLSQLTTHLEHNVSYDAAERLKVTSTVILDELAHTLAERPVGLDVEQAKLLLSVTSQLGAGLWAASRPSDVVLQVYASHPELVPARSVSASLERLVAALAAGLRAEPPRSRRGAARHTVGL